MAAKSQKLTTTGQKLVIVESPTKARTIKKFLGAGYFVESCMGHIRDLPQSAKDIPQKFKKEKWASLGVNVENGFEPIYCVPKNKTKVVKHLKDILKDVDQLILATDEDREGESISWHLLEVLSPKVPVTRMVFHEITQSAIVEALQNVRNLDENLVRAQEARRVLDRLVGYTISPLLWKKVAYGLSAGRVQSVAVRLIAEREHERLKFNRSQYWSVVAQLLKDSKPFESRLLSYKGQRVATGKDFDGDTGILKQDKKEELIWLDQKNSKSVVEYLKTQQFVVKEVEEKPLSRNPQPPFITSTLQQEANRKLGMSSKEAMGVAQKLYERGFITYMRTDSTALSQQAIDAARNCIEKLYGKNYLPENSRDYSKKKAKGAQEAHEAIRPAGTDFVLPEDTGLSGRDLQMYDLVWKRTVASQMVNSKQKQLSVKIEAGDALLAASGMTIEFPGFLKAYVEGKDDPDQALDDREVKIPKLSKGDKVSSEKIEAKDHETKPPARFTEATLVQKMEKEGIGRPSTYASIISTIQDRGYVKKIGNALAPTFTALVVSKLLKKHLPDYVDLNFTSAMEDRLDDIAQGQLDQINYLKSIYFGKEGLKEIVESREELIDPEESRQVKLEGFPKYSFRVGRYGAYVCKSLEEQGEICASLPDAANPGDLTEDAIEKLIDQKINGTDALGKDPDSGLPVYVLTGRYGPYVQLGDVDGEEAKPKRMALPKGLEMEDVTLEIALELLSLPKSLGNHSESGKEIKVGIGRFGPYVVHDGDFRSIPKEQSVFKISFEEAMELLTQPKKGRGGKSVLNELGVHPESEEKVSIMTGRYGPYVNCGKVNVSLAEDQKPESVTLAIAIEMLADKMGNMKSSKVAKKKAAAKKSVKKAKSKPDSLPAEKKTKTKKKVVLRKKG